MFFAFVIGHCYHHFAAGRTTVNARVAPVTIPGPRFRLSMLLGVVIPICILAYATSGLLPFFRRTNTPEPVQHVFLGFLLFLFGVLLLLAQPDLEAEEAGGRVG